jgi:hypothetical protein
VRSRERRPTGSPETVEELLRDLGADELIEELARPCVVCGKQMIPLRADRKTCGGTCRKRLSRARRAAQR